MVTHIVKTVLILATLGLSACGSSSGGGATASQGGAGSEAPISDTKLALKSSGVKKVLLDRTVDLRGYLVNYQYAEFHIVEGAKFAQWVDPELPKIKITQRGDVKVLVTDTRDETLVILKLTGVFDTVSEADQLPGEGQKLPEVPPWHF